MLFILIGIELLVQFSVCLCTYRDLKKNDEVTTKNLILYFITYTIVTHLTLLAILCSVFIINLVIKNAT